MLLILNLLLQAPPFVYGGSSEQNTDKLKGEKKENLEAKPGKIHYAYLLVYTFPVFSNHVLADK